MRKLRAILVILVLVALLVLNLLMNRREVASEAHGWNLILVNEDYYIPKDYAVELVTLDNGERVAKRIHSPLQEMFEAAEAEGIFMVVADGYRTQEEQQEIMDEKVEEYQERVFVKPIAEWMAEKWVAIPGTSEHQLGMAVDINADAMRSSGPEVYDWLAEHAHEYGFIQRYPSDKVDITGISYEPWHYRYVGADVAKEIFEAGICLEEYIEKIK